MAAYVPPITVLMSVYNGEIWLSESIHSILNQTFCDFEFLIINDGSCDNSLKIVNQYAAQDSRIKVFDKPNTGLADSLNYGVERARGMWIARIDADDISLPKRLEEQYNFTRCNPEFILIGGGLVQINSGGQEIKSFSYPNGHTKLVRNLENNEKFFAHSCAFISASALRKVGGYRRRLKRAQDLDLWLRLSRIGKITSVNSCLIKLRIHSAQISHEKNGRLQKLDAFIALVSYWIRKKNASDPVDAGESEYQYFRVWLESKLENDGYFSGRKAMTDIRAAIREKCTGKIINMMLLIFAKPKSIVNFIYFKFCVKRYSIKVAESWIKLSSS